MGKLENLTAGWNKLRTDLNEGVQSSGSIYGKIKNVVGILIMCVYRLRAVFMAIPVAYYALKLAAYNTANLPEMVGLRIQADGSYLEMISRATAVNGCLMITAVCLGMMFLSRKTVYPWVISIFSLIVPIFLMITNLYPC